MSALNFAAAKIGRRPSSAPSRSWLTVTTGSLPSAAILSSVGISTCTAPHQVAHRLSSNGLPAKAGERGLRRPGRRTATVGAASPLCLRSSLPITSTPLSAGAGRFVGRRRAGVGGIARRRRSLARSRAIAYRNRRSAGPATRTGSSRVTERKTTNSMWGGRFAEGPAAVMREINASIPFDKRLWRQDIAGSQAHAAMLGAQGIVSARRTPRRSPTGSTQVAADYEARRRARRSGARRHPHADRGAAGRDDRPGRRAAAHRALAQRPGRDRFPAVGARRDRPGRWRRWRRCRTR